VSDEDLLERLRAALHDERAQELSQAELRRLRQMLAAYDSLLSSGRLGRWVMTTVIMLGASIAASIKLAEYLTTLGKGGAP
jgi:hypothetical protein